MQSLGNLYAFQKFTHHGSIVFRCETFETTLIVVIRGITVISDCAVFLETGR